MIMIIIHLFITSTVSIACKKSTTYQTYTDT